MTAKSRITRRTVLQAAAALTPVLLTGCTRATRSGGEPELRATDPVARSLLYYPDTRQVPADHPLAATHNPEQKCANCVHVRGTPGSNIRPCPIFPGRQINAEGWCSIWAPA